MKKIGLLYLDVANLGDVVIFDNVNYLVNRVIKDNKLDLQIEKIDIGDRNHSSYKLNAFEKTSDFVNKCYRKILGFVDKSDKVKEYQIVSRFRHSTTYKMFNKQAFSKLKDLDCILFCGGEMIKYHAQQFYLIINEVTEIADKYNIPVIFNSVGVEGYDIKDPKCRILKKALNRKCVKFISTRDDLESLRENYNMKDSVLVCDPAFYTKEAYKINKTKNKKKTVGINVIRPEIFKSYLYDIDPDELKSLYAGIALNLIDNGYDVKFFSNGSTRDQNFIYNILESNDKLPNYLSEKRPVKSSELVKIISKYDVVVGTRLHSNIIAYALGIPTIGIVWNIKQLLFGKIYKCENNFLTKENFNPEMISDMIINKKYSMPSNAKKLMDDEYKFLNKSICESIKK